MLNRILVATMITAALFYQFPSPARAEGPSPEGEVREVTIPIGTKVYCELNQEVVSKKSEFQVGDKVDVRVWRDVVVDGQVVIPKGAPVDARISLLKTAKIAGVRGKLEIEARSVAIGGGKEVPLSGGYGKQGRGNKAVAISLSAVVAWPLIFITGKKAVLEPGTVFDAYTDQETNVALIRSKSRPTIDLSGFVARDLEVQVLYDEMKGDKIELLPMEVRINREQAPSSLTIDRVNGAPLETPLSLAVSPYQQQDNRQVTRASVELKPLAKSFRKGINRFDVAFLEGDSRVSTEVVLDVQF